LVAETQRADVFEEKMKEGEDAMNHYVAMRKLLKAGHLQARQVRRV
jgi:hypothetical protein